MVTEPKDIDKDIPTSIVIKRTERANSYEVGKAGNRFKIYFNDVEDLKRQMKEFNEAGFGVDDE